MKLGYDEYAANLERDISEVPHPEVRILWIYPPYPPFATWGLKSESLQQLEY